MKLLLQTFFRNTPSNLPMIVCSIVFTLFSIQSYSQVNCTEDTPFFEVDLSDSPDAVWSSPIISRDGECCEGGDNQVNCIELSITLHEDAAGIEFEVTEGANPGGALYFQIDCEGEPIASGSETVCLSGPGPHLISYCKVGQNQNEYSITSIPSPVLADDISITIDGSCDDELTVLGMEDGTIGWNSISPGFSGEWNHYLSNEDGTDQGVQGATFFGYSTVLVTPDENAPSVISYEVCGEPEAECITETFCDTADVTVHPPLGGDITPVEPAICLGGTDVTLTANPDGGASPHTFEWSTGETTQSIDVDSPGEYSVIMTDETGCGIAYDTVTVEEFFEEITADAGEDFASCAPPVPTLQLSGEVTGTTTGIWSGGDGTFSPDETDLNAEYTPSAAEMAAGSVTLTLTTTNNRTCPGDTDEVTITLPPYFSDIDLTVNNVTCFEACDGSISASPVGGLFPYSYEWFEDGDPIGQTTQTASNLCAGDYEVHITDAAGCEATASATVTEPEELEAEIEITDVTCIGNCDGIIEVTSTTGGTAPYTYALNTGDEQSTTTFSDLCVGDKVITITDANDCQITIDTIVEAPDPLGISLVSSIDETCGAANGSITVNTEGGTEPYEYELNGIVTPGPTFSNLEGDTYLIEVIDANDCRDDITVEIEAIPEPIAYVDTLTHLPCFNSNNGTALIGVENPATPIEYSLNGGPFQTSNSFTGLAAGNYTVEIVDNNGCTDDVSFTITQPDQLSYTTTVTPASCHDVCDGQVSFDATGGTPPYQYSSDNGLTYSPDDVLTDLCPDEEIELELVVQDVNGCLVNSTVIIPNPDPITATLDPTDPICYEGCDGTVEVDADGGNPPYEYAIVGEAYQGSNLLTGLCAGDYEVSVIDDNNCEFIGSVTLENPEDIEIDLIEMTRSNCGFANGSLDVEATGPNPPFEYSLDGGAFQATGFFDEIPAGGYTITARDDLGCEKDVFFGVNDEEMDGQLIDKTHVTCFDGDNGTVEVENIGGLEPISYELDNSGVTQASGFFDDLEAGDHIVTIYDDGQCVYNVLFTILEPEEIQFSFIVTDAVCFGGASGTIEFVDVTGGDDNYQYSIDGGATFQAGATFDNLLAGDYDLMVRDNSGCTQDNTATVDEPTLITFQTTLFHLTCFENNTGVIIISGSEGTPGYLYSIDNGDSFQTGNTFAGLAAGTYDLVVQDSEGCEVDGQVTLTEPDLLTADYTISDNLCKSSCDGQIEITPSGGTPNYFYSIDGGSTFNSNRIKTGLCADDYDVIVRDDNDCTTDATVTVDEPDTLIFDVVLTPSTCSQANGEIEIIVSGGTPDYEYSIDDGATFVNDNVFDGLLADEYRIVVRDENNCSANDRQTLTDQPSPEIISVALTHPLCNGDANGSIQVNASGGTGDLIYAIDPGPSQASNVFNDLTAGTYVITIEDENGCTDEVTRTLNDPPVLTLDLAGENLLCFENFSGSIEATAGGGTTPYQFSFDGGATFGSSETHNFIAADDYIVVVRDKNNCTETEVITITEPDELLIDNAILNDPICYEGCDGTIELEVSGGTLPYTYNWIETDGTPNENFNEDLCDGKHSYEVFDDNGCQVFGQSTLTDPPETVFNAVEITKPSCFEDCDGIIAVDVDDGDQYSIDGEPTQPNNTFDNLCDGTYHIEVWTINDCYVDTIVVVEEPELLTLSIKPQEGILCYGATQRIEAFGSGGTLPYTYDWSTGATTNFTNVTPTEDTDYTVSVTDINGCTADAETTTILVSDPLEGTFSPSNTVCRETEVTLSMQGEGGQPEYEYLWEHDESTATSIEEVIDSLTVFVAVITDQCDHEVRDTIIIDVHEEPTVDFEAVPAIGCVPEVVTINNLTDPDLIGGNCVWTVEGISYTGCEGFNHEFTEEGCYDVDYQMVTSNGCEFETTLDEFVCIKDNPIADFDFAPDEPTEIKNQIDFTNHSIDAETYMWNFNDMGSSSEENPSFIFTGVGAEEFAEVCLTAISEFGCEDQVCELIEFKPEFIFYVPNAFTPNPETGSHNRVFFPVFPPTADIKEFELLIFNRWGEIMFESKNYKVGWDGTYGGKLVPDGVYVWKITLVEGEADTEHQRVGHVSVLK